MEAYGTQGSCRTVVLCYIHGCHASVAEMLTGRTVAVGLGPALHGVMSLAVPWQSVVVIMPPESPFALTRPRCPWRRYVCLFLIFLFCVILAFCQQIRLFQKVADTNKTAEDILSSAPPFIKAFKEVASSGNWGPLLGQFLDDMEQKELLLSGETLEAFCRKTVAAIPTRHLPGGYVQLQTGGL